MNTMNTQLKTDYNKANELIKISKGITEAEKKRDRLVSLVSAFGIVMKRARNILPEDMEIDASVSESIFDQCVYLSTHSFQEYEPRNELKLIDY
jgi:hypothetical protein